MKSLRVLLVNSFYAPNLLGGAERSVRLIAEGIADADVPVAVFSFDAGLREIVKTQSGAVPLYRGGDERFTVDAFLGREGRLSKRRAMALTYDNRIAREQLSRVIDEWQPSVIHTNGIYGMSAGVWRTAKDEGVAATVHTLRDFALLDPQSRLGASPRAIATAHRAVMRPVANGLLDRVTGPSGAVVAAHRSDGFFRGIPSDVVPNAVRFEAAEVERLVDEKNARRRGTTFIYAGTLAQYKGVLDLLDAFHRLQATDVRLVLCGDGNLRQTCEARAAEDERISVLGRISDEQMRGQFAQADVAVVPSNWDEPFGRVVIESAAAGCCVIGSSRGAIPDLLRGLGCGVTFRAGDVLDLEARMREMLDPSVRCNLRKSLPHSLAPFDPAHHAQGYLATYERALA